ncbi:hypothetical protein AVXHC19_01910 [Acidovorax sacchari]
MVSTRSKRSSAQARQVVESWPPEKRTRAWPARMGWVLGTKKIRSEKKKPRMRGAGWRGGPEWLQAM